MNGKTYPYLDLVAHAPVGALLLDPRPAFIFGADGTRLLWANAAGAAFFGEERMSALLDRRFGPLNPLTEQVARLARSLPTETARLEILRLGRGVALSMVPAACRRLNLGEHSSAVLAVAMTEAAVESATTRAERLADAIAGDDCLVAVLDGEGRVLGASGGYRALEPDEDAIDTLVETARTAKGAIKRALPAGARKRPAGAVHFESEGRERFLLIVGPAEEQQAEAEKPPAPQPAQAEHANLPIASVATVRKMDAPDADADKPAPAAPRPVVRFLFALDNDTRFGVVSPELATIVGGANAEVAGKAWAAVADILGLDREGTIAKALASGKSWSARVRWPTEDGKAVAIDLAGTPSGDGGVHGFGLIHLSDRSADTRPHRTLADLAPQVAGVAAEPAQEPAEQEPSPVKEVEEPEVAAQAQGPSPDDVPAARPADGHRPASSEDLDDAARKSIEEGVRRHAVRASTVKLPTQPEPASPPQQVASNVVRLPGAPLRPPPERLTGIEEDAFRRIAESLGARQAEDTEESGRTSDNENAAPATVPVRREVSQSAPVAVEGTAEADTKLLDRLPVGIVIFRDRKTLFANRTLLDMTGYPSAAAFAHAGGAEALFPGWAGGVAETGGRLKALKRDGQPITVEVRLNAVTWAGGTALMLALSPRRDHDGEDADTLVAELGRAEARSEELAAILDTATDGVIVIDRGGKIIGMNRASEALFGVDSSEYLGQPFTRLLAEESHRAALDYLDGLASNGVASVLNDGREVIGRVPQGGLIPLFMTMGRIGDSDRFCAVLRDITHWKNVEEALVAARRAAEAANAQKSDILAKVSHEIRTPLNAIIGFSEVMMEERFGPIGNERYRTYLSDIHVSGEHLMSLINDLLDLSKIEAGKLDLSFEAVAVNAMIQESVALMQPQANRERIIIRTSLSADVPDVVADRRSLRQILLNVMSNAVKFTKAGGQVIVSSALEPNGEVVLRVRDTGVGMSERDIETALKPFRQVATSKSADQRGTGLGLPLTKALVEANRATFAIDSAVNQGTLVKITFPTTRVLAG